MGWGFEVVFSVQCSFLPVGSCRLPVAGFRLPVAGSVIPVRCLVFNVLFLAYPPIRQTLRTGTLSDRACRQAGEFSFCERCEVKKIVWRPSTF